MMEMTRLSNIGLACITLSLMGCSPDRQAQSNTAVALKTTLKVAPQAADLTQLKIASWNIANLAQSVGAELRGSYARTQDDYDDIREIIVSLDADIIAFQEIGSKAALRQVLDTNVYNFEFETRCLENETSCEADTGDIYTAIAWKTNLTENVSVFQIDALSIGHTNECGETRAVRGAVGVKLDSLQGSLHIPSLHIKASCKDDKIEPGTADDCETQRRQFEILSEWMTGLPKGEGVVLAGDFNRKLFKRRDSIARDFFSGSEAAILPTPDKRSCWKDETYKINFGAMKAQAFDNLPELEERGLNPFIYDPAYNREIDFIISEGLANNVTVTSDQIEMSGYYEFRNPNSTITTCNGQIATFEDKKTTFVFGDSLPSDHCPIISTFEFEPDD